MTSARLQVDLTDLELAIRIAPIETRRCLKGKAPQKGSHVYADPWVSLLKRDSMSIGTGGSPCRKQGLGAAPIGGRSPYRESL